MKKKSMSHKNIEIPPCQTISSRRLKEIMRIMGLYDSVHWFTWFVLCTVVMMSTALILVIILKVSCLQPRFSIHGYV